MGDFAKRHPEFLTPEKTILLENAAAAHWFDDMHDGTSDRFLGKSLAWGPASRGVHSELFDQLMKVQPQLVGLGVSVAREHRTAHDPTGKSPHSWGLAIDIDYEDNPYVLGDSSAGVGNKNCGRALSNALLLSKGVSQQIDSAYLSSLASKPTADIYDTLRDLDSAFVDYLALDGNPPGISLKLKSLIAQNSAVAALRGQDVAAASRTWGDVIRQDKQNLIGTGNIATDFRMGSATTGLPRDPTKGFLTLSKDLVVTLRDKACLAWGAVDFGSASGDMQHFDTRRFNGIGRKLMQLSGAFMPPLCP